MPILLAALTQIIYTVNRKKRGSTFDIITLEKQAQFLQFLHYCKQEETFYTLMKNMSTLLE